MKPFIHDDFLLTTGAARRLYHEFAAGLPIIDYHNHLNARDLAEDRVFENVTQLWVAADPYKHRAMRIAGVPERLITGYASDRERFDAWAATVPQTAGNPLFHWTALELKRYFDIDELLSPASAGKIWDACNELLRSKKFSARQLIARANVECLCTSDALQDDLLAHGKLAKSFAESAAPPAGGDAGKFKTAGKATRSVVNKSLRASAPAAAFRVLPSLRVDDPAAIRCEGLSKQLDRFHASGCRLADHSTLPEDTSIMQRLAAEYARRGWILQLHLGAQRQTSSRLRSLAGPAGGYATIGNAGDLPRLCQFLDALEKAQALPRTVLYPLNPADYAAVATLTGSFAEDGVRGKIQFGPAWWYNDHALGIRQHLDALAHYGLLSTFIGMTTDSRSLLSMVRHEYFRRVLCDWLGAQVENGSLPGDNALLGTLVRGVCYENARGMILV